jgi:hypothetical protein
MSRLIAAYLFPNICPHIIQGLDGSKNSFDRDAFMTCMRLLRVVDDTVFLETVRHFPAIISSIGSTLLDRLQPVHHHTVLGEDRIDTHMLLVVQDLAFPVCERLMDLLPDLTEAHFTPGWFFFLSRIHFALAAGSRG